MDVTSFSYAVGSRIRGAGREGELALPLPSAVVNDPAFRNAPENNWSGQVEGLTWQRAILALERYGYEKQVTRLGKKLLQAVIDGSYVFSRQFDPFSGRLSIVDPETKERLLPDPDQLFQSSYGPYHSLGAGVHRTHLGRDDGAGGDLVLHGRQNAL